MALDATIAGVSSNAFLTQAEATTYLTESRLYGSLWSAASSGDKDAAIIWATALLDQIMDWNGAPADYNQRLRMPRVGMKDADDRWFDSDVIPDPVKQATAELALELVKRDRSQEPKILGQGLANLKVDVISLKVDPKQVIPMIPRRIFDILEPLGTPARIAGSGITVAKLERT